MVFASRTLEVACWRATLSPDAAASLLETSKAFFSATPVPAAAKLAPGLLQLQANATHESSSDSTTLAGLSPHPRLQANDVYVRLDPAATAAASNAASNVAAQVSDAVRSSETNRNQAEENLGHAAMIAHSWHTQDWGGLHPSSSDVTKARGAGAATAVHELAWAKGFLPPFRGQHATGTSDYADIGPFWRTAGRAASLDCGTLAPVTVAVLSATLLRVTFGPPSRKGVHSHAPGESYSSTSWDACVVATLAFLSSQPEVSIVEAAPPPPVQHNYRTVGSMRGSRRVASIDTGPSGRSDSSSSGGGSTMKRGVRPFLASEPLTRLAVELQGVHPRRSLLLDTAATAVQSGDNSTGASALESTPLWRYGINGTGQLVAVTDSGFDDGSCFLRDEGAGIGLGDGTAFSSTYQA